MAKELSGRVAWALNKAIRKTAGKGARHEGRAEFIRRDPDGTAWVKLVGSDVETPVNGTMLADAKPGQMVSYNLEGTQLSVMGNVSEPAVGQESVDRTVEPVEKKADAALAEAARAHAAADAAEADALRAATAAESAETSATTAATAASNAETSAETAATAATSASGSATQAAADAATAATQATNAAGSASQAATSASNAATSASNAESSASSAAADAAQAASDASSAASSATSAQNSATSAAASATSAQNSATQAVADAGTAAQSAAQAASDASAAAGSASQAATQAGNAATSASQAATSASNAATSAATASSQASAATTAANEAKEQATSANKSATEALTQLSFVEDVAGVLDWIQSHGTFVATADTSVSEGKVYFELVQGDYVPIALPDEDANPHTEGWYELDTVTAQSDYIMSHLAVTSAGLWVLPSGIGSASTPAQASGWKMLLANDRAVIYDETGTAVTTLSDDITFDANRPQRIGNDTAYVEFSPAGGGSITIVGANVYTTTEVDEFISDEVESRNAAISQSAGEIKATVKATYASSVRNLLSGCAHPKAGGLRPAWGSTEKDTWYRYHSETTLSRTSYGIRADHSGSANGGIVIPLVSEGIIADGESLTLSFDYRGNYTATGMVYLLVTSGANYSQNVSWNDLQGDGEWHHFEKTFTSVVNADRVPYALLISYYKSAGKWFEVKDGTMMLERGSVSTRLSTAESSITQNATNINLKVSKDGVIGAINLSSESATISADKVNIAGAAIFTSGRLSESSLDDTYDAKGAAADAQAAAISAAATDATNKANAAQTAATNAANSATDEKLQSYSTTEQMESAIGDAVDDIEVGGRNLFALSTAVNGYISSAAATLGSVIATPQYTDQVTSDFVQVSPGEKFVIQMWNPMLLNETSHSNREVCWYNSSKVAISCESPHAGRPNAANYWCDIVTAPANAAYARFGFILGQSSVCRLNDVKVKVERGNKPTEWTLAPEDAQTTTRPNLHPFFEQDLTDVCTSANNPDGYWSGSGGDYVSNSAWSTQLENGWIHVERSNTGTATVNSYIRPETNALIEDGKQYTFLIELRNIVSVPTSSTIYTQQGNEVQIWGNQSYGGFEVQNATMAHTKYSRDYQAHYRVASTIGKSAHSTSGIHFVHLNWQVPAGGSINCDLRISVYEGYYLGSWKPHYTNPNAVKKTQTVYKSAADGTVSMPAPTAQVLDATGAQATWTTKRPQYSQSYPVLFVATQSKTESGRLSCTTPHIDDTTTVIDGGHIITNSITAEQIAAHSITAEEIDTDTLTIGYSQIEDPPAIPSKTSDLTNDSHFATTGDVTDAVDGLGYVGRNIALQSKVENVPTNYRAQAFGLTENLVKGETYTVQFFDVTIARSDKDTPSIGFYWGGGSVSLVPNNTIFVDENGYAKATFTAPNNSHNDTKYPMVVCYNTPPAGATGTTYNLSIGKLKIEKGENATEYTPAPEEGTTEYIVGTQPAATNAWTGKTTRVVLVPGAKLAYRLPYAGNDSAATLNLTFADGRTTGAKAVKQAFHTGGNNATLQNITKHWPAGSVIPMTWDGTQWIVENYNTNQETFQARFVNYYNTIKAKSAIVAESIIAGDKDGYLQVKGGVSFDLSYPVLWCRVALSENGTNYNSIWQTYYDRDLAVSYSGFTKVNNSTVYIEGTVVGNTFTVSGTSTSTADAYLKSDPPTTTENGKVYIPIGKVGNNGYFIFDVSIPVTLYAYLDGKFRQVTPTEIVATHRIYYRAQTAQASLAAPTTWVEEATGNTYNAWTTKVPPLAQDRAEGRTKYPYLYTCEQRKRLDGTIECTKVLLDENMTVIDGGSIITNSVTANEIAANTITATELNADNIKAKIVQTTDLSADKITSGDIAADRIKANVVSAVQAKVSDLYALVAKIGGFIIDATSIRTAALTSNADNSIGLSTADFTRTVNGTSRAGLRFAMGDKFGVTGDGVLYADGANITNISASSVTIGGGTSLDTKLSNQDTAITNAAKRADVAIAVTAIDYAAGTATLQATLYVDGTATTTNVTYKWLKDGSVISGQTSRTLSVTAAMGLSHVYSCTVTY